MLRRQARQRREYIYRKSVEDREKTILAKRAKIKKALEENRPIPTDLRAEAIEIQKSFDWQDETGEGLRSVEDDEYRWAGVEDPKIVITTSHDPSSRLKQFAKEMKLIFPNSQRMNRGKYDIKQLIEACRSNAVTDFVMLQENRGNPDGMMICHLPFGPTAHFTLYNVVMRHDIPDIGTMSEAYPHLIFNNFKTPLGQRVTNILKYLFPVPKSDSKRVMTFSNEDDFISYRHHTYKKVNGTDIELSEVGPRFEMRLYSIKLGTLDAMEAADSEFELRPYMNTSRKRQFLSVNDTEDS